jgi:hypothetical protein
MRIDRTNYLGVMSAVVLFITAMIGARQAGAEESVHKQVVVIGSPKQVKFVASATGDLPDGSLRVANEYAVVLEHVRKISGDGDVPKRLSLKMFATHEVNLSGEKLITVVLGVEEGRFFVKYWDTIRQTTCIPRELYKNERLPDGYNAELVGDKVCFKFR